MPGSNLSSETKYSQDLPGSSQILNSGITASFNISSHLSFTIYNRKKKKRRRKKKKKKRKKKRKKKKRKKKKNMRKKKKKKKKMMKKKRKITE
jgi:mannitol-specific phosphotransferase system IIBC component